MREKVGFAMLLTPAVAAMGFMIYSDALFAAVIIGLLIWVVAAGYLIDTVNWFDLIAGFICICMSRWLWKVATRKV